MDTETHPWQPSDTLAEAELMMERLSDPRDPCGAIAHSAVQSGGKRLRARLVLKLAEALGIEPGRAAPLAAAVELIHNASLVHDDLQDGDTSRRGRPATWVTHGAANAISAGDLMLMLPFRAITQLDADDTAKFTIASELARAVEEMARAQVLELTLHECLRDDALYSRYQSVVRGKTGALFRAPAFALATLAGHPDPASFARPFSKMGELFQIQDDLLDIVGDKGRGARANDVREGKVSHLVVDHLARCPEDTDVLIAVLTKARTDVRDDEVDDIVERFVRGGTIARAVDHLNARARSVVNAPALGGWPRVQILVSGLVQRIIAPVITHGLEAHV